MIGVDYVPEISRFYGIIIKMFFKPKEHEPSHIHALYGEHVGETKHQTASPIIEVLYDTKDQKYTNEIQLYIIRLL